jgi:hypothetical protein
MKNDVKIKKAVDRGREIKEEIDALEAEQDKIKEFLRSEAKARKIGYFLGFERFARVSPHTETSCDPREVENIFTDLDRHEEFYDCIKVQVGEAKKRLGDTVFESVSQRKSIPYKTVSFLANIPKKYVE